MYMGYIDLLVFKVIDGFDRAVKQMSIINVSGLMMLQTLKR